MMFDTPLFIIELSTVINLALLYLLYCLINRYVRDRSVFGNLNEMGKIFNRIDRKRQKNLEKQRNGDMLGIGEDVPVLKIPKMPDKSDLNIDIIDPKIKVETSFGDGKLGAYIPKT